MNHYLLPQLSRAEFIPLDNALHPIELSLDFNTFTSLRRMVDHQRSKPWLKRTDFMKQVTLYLPEVAVLIEESDFGYVHLEVGALKLATLDAIKQGDSGTLKKHIQMVADFMDRADTELFEALRISWLEAIFLVEYGTRILEIRRMLPLSMENLLRHSERRFEKGYRE